MKISFGIAAVTIALSSVQANADYSFCVGVGDKAQFDVTFSPNSQWENAVKIVDQKGNVIRTFNNYFGNGAGSEWQQGGGTYTIYGSASKRCYLIVGMAKYGPPNGNVAWYTSKHINQKQPDGAMLVRFEDGGDKKYNDTSVRVHDIPRAAIGGGLAVEGTHLCAPIDRTVRFEVRMDKGSTWENGVRIYGQNGQLLRTFNNFYGRGAGSEWQQGPGAFEIKTNLSNRCFGVKGIAKYGPPNGNVDWHNSKEVTIVDGPQNARMVFEDGGDKKYNDARVLISLK